ncbi:MAG: gamma-glutamyltransferase [Gemmatimonadales bacterium]|nr:MAG: gamma-glutamyltransferase [Gemmatimonadales bacterium]
MSAFVVTLLLGLPACQAPDATPPAEDLPQVDRSRAGLVSAAQPLAARAGSDMLELGGNAVDAAVAAAFTLAVVEPSMSGLGGRVQILIRTPDGEHVGIDGSTQAPSSYDPDTAPQASYGYDVIGVPGVPAGLLKAHGEYGTLPRSTVMAPAIQYAEEGFELLPREAERHASAREQLAEFEGSRAYFLRPDGTTHPPGTLFRQPDLARTLRVIESEGVEGFYRGSIAQTIAADMDAHGAPVTLESLEEYEARSAQIVHGSYRDHDLVSLWVPSAGAITIQVLHLLETRDVASMTEAEWAQSLAEAIRVAYVDRPNQRTWEDAERLTSKAYAVQRAELMRVGAWEGSGAGAVPDGHTTHLTAADRSGMVVALTQSLGPSMGSKVASPELGFLYASTLGGYLGRMEPGERARSHISPLMVERDGQPFLALGAAGGGRIPTSIVAAVSRIIDGGMSLEDALAAPRIVPDYPSQTLGGDLAAPPQLEVETQTGMGFAPEVVDALEAMGYQVEVVERTGAFGRVHAVRWNGSERLWVGAADPDWEGAVAVPREMIR